MTFSKIKKTSVRSKGTKAKYFGWLSRSLSWGINMIAKRRTRGK